MEGSPLEEAWEPATFEFRVDVTRELLVGGEVVRHDAWLCIDDDAADDAEIALEFEAWRYAARDELPIGVTAAQFVAGWVGFWGSDVAQRFVARARR